MKAFSAPALIMYVVIFAVATGPIWFRWIADGVTWLVQWLVSRWSR